MGIWFRTRQYAFTPQRPGQGSWHLRLIQALSEEQSELTLHSGLQLGGEPIIWGWQLHSQRSPITLGKFELGPQGLGSQGSTSSTIGSMAKSLNKYLCKMCKYFTYSMVEVCILWKGLQCTDECKCKWEYGLKLYTRHWLHKVRGKGPHIWSFDMLY